MVIAGAMDALERFANRLDIPVATSIFPARARSQRQIPSASAWSAPMAATDETWEAMTSADLVVFMGCRAGSTTTRALGGPDPGSRIVHFDSDPMVLGANYQAEVAVSGRSAPCPRPAQRSARCARG